MSSNWKARLVAGAAFVSVFLVHRHFGIRASVVAVVGVVLSWWLLDIYIAKRLDRLCKQLLQLDLDDEQKERAFGKLDPEIRRDIEKRIAKEKNC